MVQKQTRLKVSDNSGAKIGGCIRVLKGSYPTYAYVGDCMAISIKKLKMKRKAKKKDIYFSVLIRSAKETQNKDGSWSKFKQNAVTLLNKKKKLLANKITGPLSKSLRKKQYSRIYTQLRSSLI